MLIPYRYLQLPIFPKSLQRIGKAGSDYKASMERMLDGEFAASERGEPGAGGLMTSFVRALSTREAQQQGSRKTQGLSREEIFGNIFVLNLAGHNTTANTLAFTMYLLATRPDVQEWIAEEVRSVASEEETDWDYSRMFPHPIRCRAVLVCIFHITSHT